MLWTIAPSFRSVPKNTSTRFSLILPASTRTTTRTNRDRERPTCDKHKAATLQICFTSHFTASVCLPCFDFWLFFTFYFHVLSLWTKLRKKKTEFCMKSKQRIINKKVVGRCYLGKKKLISAKLGTLSWRLDGINGAMMWRTIDQIHIFNKNTTNQC